MPLFIAIVVILICGIYTINNIVNWASGVHSSLRRMAHALEVQAGIAKPQEGDEGFFVTDTKSYSSPKSSGAGVGPDFGHSRGTRSGIQD